MRNSHYVPRLTLRRFGNKICLYNVRTGEFAENVNIDKAFAEKGFYSDETENLLNFKIESQFGNLLNKKILTCRDAIEISRDELRIIKKFLLVSVIRSIGSETLMPRERNYYENAKAYSLSFARSRGLTEAETIQLANSIEPPFKEKIIEGETNHDYWIRTLNVILDSDGTPEDILKSPDKTYPSHRWAQVINNGFLAFWDSEYDRDEFVITDIGMTSENEKGWDGIFNHNHKKTDFLMSLLKKEKDPQMQTEIYRCMSLHHCFTENFMMFPISAKRMIVEIDPFYKFRIQYARRYKMPLLNDLTVIPNEKLFYPNDVKYVLPQNGKSFSYHPDDKYIYKINKLSKTETRYCNALFLDRIDSFVGFSSLAKVVGSLIAYKKYSDPPKTPRVDYAELYKIIENRYGGNLNV